MFMLLIFSLMMTSIFLFLNHPLTMGITLLTQAILISLILGSLYLNFWFSYILFLIMIGGMLVLFIYMTSIASNEKFNFSWKIFFFISTVTFSIMVLYMLIDQFYFTIMYFNIEMIDYFNKFSFSLSKFINYPMNMILFMMIIYLFITLIAVVKITDINFGPLRQKN